MFIFYNNPTYSLLILFLLQARNGRNNDALSQAISQYDACLEAYIPVVMAMAHIYWEAENYPQVNPRETNEKPTRNQHEQERGRRGTRGRREEGVMGFLYREEGREI